MNLGFRGVHYKLTNPKGATHLYLYNILFNKIISLCLVNISNILLVNHINQCVDYPLFYVFFCIIYLSIS